MLRCKYVKDVRTAMENKRQSQGSCRAEAVFAFISMKTYFLLLIGSEVSSTLSAQHVSH